MAASPFALISAPPKAIRCARMLYCTFQKPPAVQVVSDTEPERLGEPGTLSQYTNQSQREGESEFSSFGIVFFLFMIS
jgi:hypothetical protein